MDNPISWAILLVLVILFSIWFAAQCDKELSKNREENERFFRHR